MPKETESEVPGTHTTPPNLNTCLSTQDAQSDFKHILFNKCYPLHHTVQAKESTNYHTKEAQSQCLQIPRKETGFHQITM